jgi:hypothetical protein
MSLDALCASKLIKRQFDVGLISPFGPSEARGTFFRTCRVHLIEINLTELSLAEFSIAVVTLPKRHRGTTVLCFVSKTPLQPSQGAIAQGC